jgi:UDP-glucose 4-epimerase
MAKHKVIVFGGAGFLGSYVVNELERRDYDVIVADIKPSLYIKSSQFIECDITDKKAIANVIPINAFAVYNFAGFASLEQAADNPIETIELNILGNLNVLEISKTKGCKHFVFASSAYAMNDMGSFYGISKLSSEKIIEEYNAKYNLPYTIIRYGSVYSERDFDNNYIYNLIKTAKNTSKIVHNGDGQEIREYIHAADAATLSVDIIEDKKFKNQHIILTGFEKMKRIELFEMINEIMGNTLSIKLDDKGNSHHYRITPYSIQANVSKKLISNPFIDMGQGILECIKAINND